MWRDMILLETIPAGVDEGLDLPQIGVKVIDLIDSCQGGSRNK
jgi:hypothetical protein